ncbi:MAG: hypothetical protein VW258_01625 [Thalassolituus sp.]
MLFTYLLLSFFIIAGGLATCAVRETRQPMMQKVPVEKNDFPSRR